MGYGIFVGTEMCNVRIGGFKGCGSDYGLVSGRTADFNCGVFNALEVGGGAEEDGVTIKWTIFNDDGTLKLSGSGACGGEGGISIDSRQRGVHIDDLRPNKITLNDEDITSWSDLTKYVGGGTETNNKIQRFTSPELPANCSQFYFEGCGTVTGTKFQLPFIQVRETATGKLVQTPEMDVWVNLNETCTAYTLGKPIANIEPCTSAIEAGKWTAIVMN